MKVIVAGYSKTGTKSMDAALTELGYKVYDSVENLFMLCDDYSKILSKGWTTEDFRRMYAGADAVVDSPACHFWEEIHKAFPDAKIILTMRESEDVWFKSLQHQVDASDTNIALRLMEFMSPTYISFMNKVGYTNMACNFGVTNPTRWRIRTHVNEALTKMKYRAHNAHVLNNAPKDKLLVYSCSEGWGPLCKFLEVPEPEGPFPRKNVRGNIVEEMMNTDPVLLKMQRELMISMTALVAGTSLGSYLIYRMGFRGIYDYACSSLDKWWRW